MDYFDYRNAYLDNFSRENEQLHAKKYKDPYEKIECPSCKCKVSRCNLNHHKKTKKHKVSTGDDEFLFSS